MNAPLARLFVVASLLSVPGIGAAQQQPVPTVARVTPYVGYVTFGALATGPLGTQISNRATTLYGIQAGLDITHNLSLVGNLGYADSDIEIGLPIIGGISIADSKVLLYDGGLQLRLPGLFQAGAHMVPYVEAGVGAIRYQVTAGPLTTNSTNVAANIGGGVDMQLNGAIGLRMMARDYIGRFDFRDVTGLNLQGRLSHNLAYGVGVTFGF